MTGIHRHVDSITVAARPLLRASAKPMEMRAPEIDLLVARLDDVARFLHDLERNPDFIASLNWRKE